MDYFNRSQERGRKLNMVSSFQLVHKDFWKMLGGLQMGKYWGIIEPAVEWGQGGQAGYSA